MMKRALLTSGLLLFTLAMAISAPLTIEDAQTAAKNYDADYSLAIRQYANAVQITNRTSSFTPSLSLTGSISSGAGFFTPSGWDPTFSGINGSVGLSTGFTFSGSSLTEKKTKELTNEQALQSLESEERSLDESVVSAYVAIAQTRGTIKLYQSSLDTANEQLKNVQERYNTGYATELELVQAENSVSEAEYNLKSYQSSYELYILSFKNLTGIDATELELVDIASMETVDILSASELYDRYAYSSPTILNMDLSLRTAELNYDTTKNSAVIPSFNLNVGYTVNGNYKRSGTNSRDGFSDGLTATATVSVPIDPYFSSSSKNANIATAKNAAEDAKTELGNALVTFRYTLEQSCQTIGLEKVQIENQEKKIAALERELELMQNAYNAGEQSLSSLQTTENSLISAQNTLLSQKSTYLKDLYTLARTLGISYSQLLEA